MLVSWRRHQSIPIETVLDELGTGWRERFDADQPLHPGEVAAFARSVGLTAEAPQSFTPAGIAGLLGRHGPLWVIGDDAVEGNHLTHVRVVTGIHDDTTSPDATSVTLVDPAESAPRTETFGEFRRRLEAGDVVEVGLGIMHF